MFQKKQAYNRPRILKRNCSRNVTKKPESNYKIITSLSQWREISGCFEQSRWLGLDTEFMRERTYYPQLCLVQMAGEKMSVCLDPLSFNFAEIISGILSDRRIVKILHSSSQDIEVLGQYCDIRINNLFDTQLAAEFCGIEAQIGYAALVNELLGIELPKSQTRSNWAKRPLTPKQIEYSFNDVNYLKPLYDRLTRTLDEKSLFAWFEEEQRNELEKMAGFEIRPEQAYLNFKASNRLNARAQQLVKVLLNWRELTAQSSNKPKHWIIKDRAITDIAMKMPENMDSLESIVAQDLRFNKKYLAELYNLIDSAVHLPSVAVWADSGPLTESQKKQISSLRKDIMRKSEQFEIPSTRLATRKDMVEFVQTGQGRLAQGWRAELMNG